MIDPYFGERVDYPARLYGVPSVRQAYMQGLSNISAPKPYVFRPSVARSVAMTGVPRTSGTRESLAMSQFRNTMRGREIRR